MKYVPKETNHNSNVTKESLFYHFFLPAGAIVLAVVIIVFVLTYTAKFLIQRVSVRHELMLVKYFSVSPSKKRDKSQSAYLNRLGYELSLHDKDFPYDATVYTLCTEDPNAFAFFGGTVVVNHGLFKTLKSENGLSFVLAHELGHLKHRHHLAAMSRGILLSLVGSIIGFDSFVSSFATHTLQLSALSFSRDQEREADAFALEILREHYGHTNGADEFFQYIEQKGGLQNYFPAILSTHPAPQERIEALRASNSPNGVLTPFTPPDSHCENVK